MDTITTILEWGWLGPPMPFLDFSLPWPVIAVLAIAGLFSSE